MTNFELIKGPIITEASIKAIETENRYTFKVDKKANKVQIKKAIEEAFGIKVISVSTTAVPRRYKKVGRHEGYASGYKKAIVKIEDGKKIDAFNI